jgi:hypothetical protein
MINVEHYEAAIAALPGENIIVPRAQIRQLLAEVKVGQHARRALTTLKTAVTVAASQSGAPA